MTTTSTKKPSTRDEIAFLKAKIAELEAKENDKSEAPVKSEVSVKQSQDYSEVKIQQDEYISVMSLLPFPLNLSTREGGQGNTKKFSKFGEVKRIMYKDLVDIMEVHSNFLEAGYFYILNPAVVRHHGLNDIYSKILTKDKIEEILSANSEEASAIYKTANPKQQEIIIELLIEKVKNDPESVDLNIVDRISRLAGINIVEKAEQNRESEKDLMGEGEEEAEK